MKTFEEVLNSALSINRKDREAGLAFSSALGSAVNTFGTKGVRAEAVEYGKSHPQDMVKIGLAWVFAMDYAYLNKRTYCDARNELACERCKDFINIEAVADYMESLVNDTIFVQMEEGFKKHTLVYMHRTNIQTATQVLFEGLFTALELVAPDVMSAVSESCVGDLSVYTRLPMI